MKKNRIWIIIFLMSLALAGIILVQVFWINNALKQKEKIFSYQVNDALNTVASKVENHWVAGIMNSQLNNMMLDSMNAAIERSKSSAQFTGDTLVSKFFDAASKNDGLHFESHVQISSNSPDALLNEKPTMFLEPFEYKGNLPLDVMPPDYDLAPQILSEIDKQFEVNTARLNKLMQQMLLEMMTRSTKPEEKIDTAYLQLALKNELTNRGITTDYNYGVLVNGDYFISNVDAAHKKNLLMSKHKANLFPGDMFSKPDFLLIDFPNQTNYLLSSVWMLLLGSLLFTAIIIFGFSYTISIIFRQKKLSEIKSDFINNMTHEFKTPLATISLAVDAINNPVILSNTNKVQHYTHIIKEENKRMNGQVEKVLQMALLDKNQINLSKDEIDMHDIIQRAVDNISLLVHEKGGELHTELNAEHFEIIADEVHMMNVIYNLLDNANKYSPENPHITIRTESDKKGLYISVEDKGIGMSPEYAKMIFEKFYRVPTGNIHNVKGFGLGLAYVKAILEAHNGNIDVKSHLHKGSTFKIFLPFEY